ncbi:hypothetical protein Vafri_17254 [Volvox africanus]|uniref:Uncharacterized protein n=1 Tax=Volvox africanus TaxID=51714 RepID=A0A8J4BIY6_9CHLO|nr:hypothetical protein Vafri_17254 [Volvox africanus]
MWRNPAYTWTQMVGSNRVRHNENVQNECRNRGTFHVFNHTKDGTMSHAASLRSSTTEDSFESTLQAIQEEQLSALSRLRAVRSRLHNCNDALAKVLIALRAAGAEVARDMRGMREDMDAAYAVLGTLDTHTAQSRPQ